MASSSEQGFPNPPRRRVPWQRDPIILARMQRVQRRHFEGWSNTRIALELEVDEGTVRNDLKRLDDVWMDEIKADAHQLRAQAAAELADVKHRALQAAERDEQFTKAVLFEIPYEDDDGVEHTIRTDDKGRADYRGQAAQHLNTARQAVMDRAKVLALISDRVDVSGETTRRVVILDGDDGGAADAGLAAPRGGQPALPRAPSS